MKLGTEINSHDRRLTLPIDRLRLTERWGYDAVFSAENFGTDAISPLAYVAALTNRLTLSTCVIPVTARPPTVTAQAFQTLDQLAGRGRAMIGVGSSYPMNAEGWAGQRFGSRLERMRNSIAIMRAVNAGKPVEHSGKVISIPYRGPGHGNIGPVTIPLDTNPDMPILVGCLGDKMVTLTAELADGWLPTTFNPLAFKHFKPLLEDGFRRAGAGKGFHNFQIWPHCDVIVDKDVRAAMRPCKEFVATYTANLRPVMTLLGLGDIADRIIELRLDGRFEEAVAAVPDDYIDTGWLCGPLERIAERAKANWADCGATGLIVRYGPLVGPHKTDPENLEAYRVMARVFDRPAI